MSITKILTDKNLEAAEKLEKVSVIVKKAREAYGNADTEIKEVRVDTAFGSMPFSGLEADSKVEILRNQALSIKSKAVQLTENVPGTVLTKKVEELLAVNPYFANAAAGADYDYL